MAALPRFAVLRRVMQLDLAAGSLLGGVNHAAVKRAGIDVQADRALVEVAGIVDAVHGFERVHGAGMGWIHFHGVGGLELAFTLVDALMEHSVVFYQKASYRYCHPAVLVAMVVDGTHLPDFPADGYEFVEGSLVN